MELISDYSRNNDPDQETKITIKKDIDLEKSECTDIDRQKIRKQLLQLRKKTDLGMKRANQDSH